MRTRKPIQQYGATPMRRYTMHKRRELVVEIMIKEPGIQQDEIARRMGVDRSTISRDLKALTEQMKIQNSEAFLMERQRILNEIRINKQECMNRLSRLSEAHRGSRWMEEWTKLVNLEVKILGVASPDHLVIEEKAKFDKAQEDAAIDAVIGTFVDDVIDITPNKDDDDKKQLPMAS